MPTGLARLEEAINQSAKGGGYSGRLGYLKLAADETIVIRFLTDVDDIITCDFYEWVAVEGSDKKPAVFPRRPDLLEDPSAEDFVVKYGFKQTVYKSTDLGPLAPKRKTVGLAVVREEELIKGEGRPKVTYKDKWSEVETKDGKKFEAREFITVNMSYKNFWAPLVGYYHEYGTLCDRDYKIKRVGGDQNTTYLIMPQREDEGWNEDGSSYAELHESYGYGKPSDPESDERFAYCPQTLQEWAEDQCSEQRVKYFATPSGEEESTSTPSKSLKSDDDEAGTVSPPPASSGGGSLQERLARHKA